MRAKKSTPYLYMIPSLIMVLVFVYIPVITNIVYSFLSLSPYSSSAKFVSTSNCVRFFTKDTPLIMLKNNRLYCIISLAVQVGFGTLLTLLLESKAIGRLRSVHGNIYYIPTPISLAAVSILLTLICQPDLGMLNSFLRAIRHEDMARSQLGNSKIAIYCITAMSQWQFTGYITLPMAVVIQNVPNDYIEVASTDGVGPVKRAFHTILPLVKEQLLVCLIVTVIGASKLFIEIYSITRGGPRNSAQILGVLFHQNAFLHDDLGVTAVTGVFIFMITTVPSLTQMRITRSGGV